MSLTSAPKTTNKDGEFDKYLPDIFAREENAAHDYLNNITFDPANYTDIFLGDFIMNQRRHVKIPARPNRSEYYYTTPQDNLCSCGFHVASQLSHEEMSKTGIRLYIPRLRVNDASFNHTHTIYDEIAIQLGNFCNIVHIELQWLHNVGDFAAFIYLDLYKPFKQNNMGKTAMCNLSCPKCKSLTIHLNQHIFWKVLPPN